MTRSHDDYRKILELWEAGYLKKTIAKMTGIPRATVRDCINRYGNIAQMETDAAYIEESKLARMLQGDLREEDKTFYEAYSYLLGLYLGDGYLAKAPRVYKLRIFLDARYPNIIKSCGIAIQTLLPENSVGQIHTMYGDGEKRHLSSVEVYCNYKDWPDVFPQHGKGMKHQREIRLEGWQQKIVDSYPLEFLRGLYHSDGSRFSNVVKGKDYPRYQFTNVSDDITNLFCDTCDKLGIHWTHKIRPNPYANDVFISKRADVEYLDRVVGPKS